MTHPNPSVRADAARNRLLDAARVAFASQAQVYASTGRERADALRAVLASDAVTASPAHAQLCATVQAILAAGTLRDDVHAEDIVVTLVGMVTTTSPAGGRKQLGRMLDLLMDAVRCPVP
ncbi:hypothetical protein [Streptomyces acidiscabies]|uniref:hypothetical protein n=1 Tax=Streptomyces acidiscabies TaxID=42234 RepID=UPI00131BF2AE|nr:hypothetical protein [Streptomyces acidiscabies]